MEVKTTRLNLKIPSALYPSTSKWLDAFPIRLRVAKILQYVEMHLTADANGWLLHSSRIETANANLTAASLAPSSQSMRSQIGNLSEKTKVIPMKAKAAPTGMIPDDMLSLIAEQLVTFDA
jgi:hypothetical protein